MDTPDSNAAVWFDPTLAAAEHDRIAQEHVDLVAFLRRFLTSTDYDRDEREARALLARIDAT